MDTFTLYSLINEIKEHIEGARINKIFQPDENIFLLRLSTGKNFIINISPQFNMLFISNRKLRNPKQAPAFCMLLRKYIENGTIIEIESIKFYRTVILKILKRGEIYHLQINLSGKNGNVLLLDEQHGIIANYKNFSQMEYKTITKLSFDIFKNYLETNSNIPGFPPFMLKEFLYISKKTNVNYAFEKYNELYDFKFKPNPVIINNKVYPFRLKYMENLQVEHDISFNDAFDYLFDNKDFLKTRHQLISYINKKISKHRKIIQSIEREYEEKKNYKDFFKYGELLKANFHLLTKGKKSVKVTDYYSSKLSEIEIVLKQDKTPQENIEHYFKIAKKGKRGIEKLKERKTIINETIKNLEETLYFLENAKNIEELEGVGIDMGFKKKERHTENIKPNYKDFLFEGITIIVGNSGSANDFIRKKFGKPDYLWLHVKDFPGSHVIITEKEENLSREIIDFAAKKALEYSKCRENRKGEVLYTKLKYVKKPKGSPPGLVTLKKFKTVFVKLS